MSTQKSNPAPHSEEELLEQWAFLDRLVERQAAQLRAGVQDGEDVDEPVAGSAELEGLRRELDRLHAELRQAQGARQAAERELASRTLRARREMAELTRRLGEVDAARQRAERAGVEAVEALRQARLELERLRAERAGRHGGWPSGPR